MMFYTHLAFGFLLAFLSLKIFSVDNLFLFFVGIFVGSLFVDIDNFKSKIGSKTFGLSYLFQTILGHRGIFHSLLFAILLSFALSFVSASIAYGFFIGYFSHLIIDSFNIQGVKLFYPFSKQNFKGFIRVNGLIEKLIFVVLVLVDVFVLYYYIL